MGRASCQVYACKHASYRCVRVDIASVRPNSHIPETKHAQNHRADALPSRKRKEAISVPRLDGLSDLVRINQPAKVLLSRSGGILYRYQDLPELVSGVRPHLGVVAMILHYTVSGTADG